MWVYICYKGERMHFHVNDEGTVSELMEMVRKEFSSLPDLTCNHGDDSIKHKVLVLNFNGSDLNDNWILSDIGIPWGSTLRVVRKDRYKPLLHVQCVFNKQIIPLLDKTHLSFLTVKDVRSIIVRKIGLPVGTFSLVTHAGKEMHDMHAVSDYGLELGATIRLEIWNGWCEFVCAAISGHFEKVMNFVSRNKREVQYQMRVALYIAAHYGHVDLAVNLLKYGIKADEPVGDHPKRLWCKDDKSGHIDRLRLPVHVAAEMGQLGVLRTFVHYDICNLFASDGNGLKPLNVALRSKQKPCALFLLTKQWSKKNYNGDSILLSLYAKMKRWADISRERAFLIHGPSKSSLRNPRVLKPEMPLCGMGVFMDGASSRHMRSKSFDLVRQQEERDNLKRKRRISSYKENLWLSDINPEQYFKTLRLGMRSNGRGLNKLTKIMFKSTQDNQEKASSRQSTNGRLPSIQVEEQESDIDTCTTDGEIDDNLNEKASEIKANEAELRFPSLNNSPRGPVERTNKSKETFSPAQNLPTVSQMEPKLSLSHGGPTSKTYIQTGFRNESRAKSTVSLSRNMNSIEPIKEKVLEKPNPERQERITETETYKSVMTLYGEHRGMTAKEHAALCLQVANSFKKKAWLHQMRQALVISARGVKKTLERRQDVFLVNRSKEDQSVNKHKDPNVKQDNRIGLLEKAM